MSVKGKLNIGTSITRGVSRRAVCKAGLIPHFYAGVAVANWGSEGRLSSGAVYLANLRYALIFSCRFLRVENGRNCMRGKYMDLWREEKRRRACMKMR